MSEHDECENVLLGIMETNRNAETNDIPTRLDDILTNVYDLNQSSKDFNSTMIDNRLFNAGINSVSNNFNLNFSGDTSLYVTALNSSLDSSMYTTNPLLHNATEYQSSSSTLSYPTRSENNDYMEYLVDQKMYNMSTTTSTKIQEEDNDPSPVYLNFNLQNMSQPSQTFNTELEKIANQMINRDTENKNETLKYVEYINDVEETVQTKLVDNNCIERNQMFQQIPTNIVSPSLTRCSFQQVYDVSQDINANNMIEVVSTYQPINDMAFAKLSDLQQPNMQIHREVIIRKPLQTKLTVKPKLSNLEWILINNNNNNENTNDMCTTGDFSTLENVVPDIPFIRDRPQVRRGRKQSLAVLTESEISFMNTKGEFSKWGSDLKPLAVDKPKIPIDTSFVTFRKKIKPIETFIDPIEDTKTKTTARNQNNKKSNLRETCTSNLSEILISTDTDSEDDLESNEIKCLNCKKCKKMFKTARTYSIHEKRCDAPGFAENPYVIEVEYLESEKEDEFEPISSPERYVQRSKRTLSSRKKTTTTVEIESDSIHRPKNLIADDSNRSDEYVTRRNTRSSQKSYSTHVLPASGSSNRDSPTKLMKPRSSSVSFTNRPASILCCDVCGKTFRQKSYLTAHKRIHQKHYKCQFCFKSFAIKSAYDSHVVEKCDKIPTVKLKKLRSMLGST